MRRWLASPGHSGTNSGTTFRYVRLEFLIDALLVIASPGARLSVIFHDLQNVFGNRRSAHGDETSRANYGAHHLTFSSPVVDADAGLRRVLPDLRCGLHEVGRR